MPGNASFNFQSPGQAQGTVSADEKEIIDERPLAAKPQPYLLFTILAVCAVTFFAGIGRLALTGPDEPRYAEVSREMFVTGDYISPRLGGCLWFEKPVLVYWMAAASYSIFGVGEYAARFPAALCASMTALAIFFVLRGVGSTGWAMSASLALATTGIFIGFARSITMDMALASTISLALLSGYRATLSSGRARLAYWAGCGAAAGLSCLAKGFVGAILVGVILGLYLIVVGKLNRIGRREIAIAVAAIASVAGIWYIPVIIRHGDAFIDSFIIEHHFERYFTTVHRHPQPVYFFLFVVLAGLMPWTFLLFPAITRIRTLRPRASERDSLLALSWIWLAVPLLFFSFSGSKLPGYILPVFPALAIIIGAELERIWRGERSLGLRIALWLNALLLLAIGIAFLVYLRIQEVAVSAWQISLKLAPLVIAVFALSLLARSKMRQFLLATGVVVMLVVVGSVVLLLPKLSYTLSYKSLSLEAAAQLRPGERIGFFRMKEFAPAFYSEGRVVCGTGDGAILNASNPERLVPVLERESSIILFTEKNWLEGLERDERFILERIGEQRKAVALRVSLLDRDPD